MAACRTYTFGMYRLLLNDLLQTVGLCIVSALVCQSELLGANTTFLF